MTRNFIIGAAAAATLASVPFRHAIAETGADTQTRAAITVMAPRVSSEESSDMIGKERTLTASSVVYIDDLNLRTPSGRDELENRVKTAARETCLWLDDVYPLGIEVTSERECINDAVESAQAQMDRALANYG